MASSSTPATLALLFLLGFLSISASAARPCKTLMISSYSFSFKPISSDQNNPNPWSSGFVTITEISQFNPATIVRPSFDSEIFPDLHDRHKKQQQESRPLGFSSYDMSSLRDRTKDILSVVVALLFGVGCGALTAATMYLAWSIFTNRFDLPTNSYDEADFGEDEDDVSPKKMGYVKIPAATAAAADGSVPQKQVA